MPFPLFTSIKPPAAEDDLSYLRRCLNSWRAAGFDPVSVNGPSEIAALRKLDLPVEFSPVPTDGKPSIMAIFSAIFKSDERFVGIINSDCIIAYPGIADNLRAGLNSRKGSIILAWRIDVDGTGAKACPWGFDAFFFDMAVIPNDDFGFCIGEACWDYWFPMACDRNGAIVETLDVPLLVHKVHPQSWRWEDWENNMRRIWAWTGRTGSPSVADLHALTASIWTGFHARPPTICVTGTPEIEAALNSAGRAMMQNESTFMNAESARLRSANEQLKAEVASMRNATFWQLTAPLRAAIDAARALY
jgi:hypothetical protein